MAEGVNESQRVVRASDEHAADRPLPAVHLRHEHGTARSSFPHSHKFLAATAMLAGIAVGALAVAVAVLMSSSKAGVATRWSTWSPPDNGLAGEREIADTVAPFYRATRANQLVVVTVHNVSSPSSTGAGSGTELALRDPTSGILSAIPGNSAVYNLCGLAAGCAVDGGSASQARLLLLRREALELSLYTFRYMSNIQNVVAILPPGRTTQGCTGICSQPNAPTTTKTVNLAVVFQRQGLQRFVDQPLRLTLPEPLPPSVSEMAAAPEAELVSVLTGQSLYQQHLVQAQDGSSVLVLDPVPPQ
jgi:hypothetical protein